MLPFTDEELVAYADGELPAARAEQIAAAARGDAAIAQRIQAFRDSRRVLREAFADSLDQPVPQKLLDLLAEPEHSNVVAFKPRHTRLTTWIPLAAAASVALAVGLGFSGVLAPRSITPVVVADAGMLNTALETLASGVPLEQDGKEVLPLATLRTAAGRWCREFEARSGAGATLSKSRGLACREGNGTWEPRVIAGASLNPANPANPATASGYQTASGGEPDLSAALGAAQRLTPGEEQDRIARHWVVVEN